MKNIKEKKRYKKKKEYENEKEIKENCEILINNEKIPFDYFHTFNEKGQYTIHYLFKNLISRINHIFFQCKSLININLSNFKTQNVTNMSDMSFWCRNLTSINYLISILIMLQSMSGFFSNVYL